MTSNKNSHPKKIRLTWNLFCTFLLALLILPLYSSSQYTEAPGGAGNFSHFHDSQSGIYFNKVEYNTAFQIYGTPISFGVESTFEWASDINNVPISGYGSYSYTILGQTVSGTALNNDLSSTEQLVNIATTVTTFIDVLITLESYYSFGNKIYEKYGTTYGN